MSGRRVIAIDGPAGSGKSTVARLVARALGYTYIDTGAMYRALTVKALREGTDLRDPEALAGLALRTDVRVTYDSEREETTVHVDGRDVTADIRSPEVNSVVSLVAAAPGVRKRMAALQKAMAEGGSVVLEGRDTCTTIVPGADGKFFLTASLEERARRRQRELMRRGYPATLAEVQEQVAQRDRLDSERAESPLRVAPGAKVIDTTRMTVREVVNAILGEYGRR